MLDKKTVSQCISSDYCRGWNDAMDEMPRWNSVEERLPERYTHVLVITRFSEDAWDVVIAYHALDRWRKPEGMIMGKVTHWMPLPEPPKEE